MTLDEWSSIPESQQHEVIIQWYKNDQWEIYQDMVCEAARLLRDQLKLIHEVTNVTGGRGKTLLSDGPARWVSEITLSVCTSLPELSSRFEQLPTRFFGFRVEQVNFGDKRDVFLKTLNRILKELKGWSETDTLKWGDTWLNEPLIDSLNGGFLSLAVYSHGPVKLAVYAILDERTMEAVEAAGNHHIDLHNQILSVIYGAVKKAGSKKFVHIEEIPNLDWDSVRHSVKGLLEKAYCGQSRTQNSKPKIQN
jgi:hypothetical protein